MHALDKTRMPFSPDETTSRCLDMTDIATAEHSPDLFLYSAYDMTWVLRSVFALSFDFRDFVVTWRFS